MEQATLHDFEKKCIQEEAPACQSTCPFHLEARSFVKAMAEQKNKEARALLERALPLACVTAYLCEGPCLAHCRRAEIDSPVNLPLLERTCLLESKTVRPFPLPSTNKKVALVGGSLSALACAWELGKKGHLGTVFYAKKLGGRLSDLAEQILPAAALAESFELLKTVRVNFIKLDSPYQVDWLHAIKQEYAAIYFARDDIELKDLQYDRLVPQQYIADKLTLATKDPQLFASNNSSNSPFVSLAFAGKKAAASIDRLLQQVSPATARQHEGPYPSSLFTDISKAKKIPPVNPKKPSAPTSLEARDEALRCLQCECLECLKACPYLAFYKGYPKKYAREIYNNLAVVHGLRKANTMINACAECGLCAAICPQGFNMGHFCALARTEMVQSKRMPPSAHEFALLDMEQSNSPDTAFLRHQPGTTQSRFLFFPGCQAPASIPKQIQAAYLHLCAHLDGGVGLFFACCGAPAKWSGRPKLTSATAHWLRQQWHNADQAELITACPSCQFFFQQELPEIPVRSLWEHLLSLPVPEQATACSNRLALHDPCSSRDNLLLCTSVRQLLQTIDQAIQELPLSKETTRCCGYGGLAAAAAKNIGALYAQARADDTELPLLSYCIMCRDRLHSSGKASLHLLDCLFPQEPFEKALQRPAPSPSRKQETRAFFKHSMLNTLWDEKNDKLNTDDQPQLQISEEVERLLDNRNILHADIRLVLRHAAQHGFMFLRHGSKRRLTALRPRQVSFWVEYEQKTDGTYIIHDAYCHRMLVPGIPGQGLPSPCTLEGLAAKGGRL